jgi:TctA family transporter
LAIHWFSSCCLFFLFSSILAAPKVRKQLPHVCTLRLQVALGAVALWSLHPIQTNVATYVIQRMASLSGLFSFLCVGAYVRGRCTEGEWSWKWACLSAFSLLLALAGKESGATVIPLLVVTEFVLLDRPESPRARRVLRALFALMVLGLSIMVYLAKGSIANTLIVVCFGLILGTAGLDPMTGTPRFVYKITSLMDGVGLIQVVIGLFGVSEVLLNVETTFKQDLFETKVHGLLPNREDWKKSIGPIGRGSIIGFFLGVIPGMSVAIPTFVSYVLEKRLSKYPEKFGTGVIEGVAGPEAANNAASTGTLVPMLSLGIPTGPSTALLLGALMIHGVRPGPLLIQEAPEVFWGVVASLYVGNVMLLVLNLPLIGLWVKILRIPYHFLFSLILLLCIIGSYITNNNPYDVVIMAIFGLIGYLMKKFDYEAAPLVLALVLGPMMETALRRSLVLSDGGFWIFFSRPITATFLAVALLILLSPALLGRNLLSEELRAAD